MRRGFVCCALLLLCCWGYLGADGISDRIQLNGFLSQAFVYSTGNDFVPGSSDSGSFEMNEFGLTISADVTSKLRIGFQLLARDFGPVGNHKLTLDWGFADYRFSGGFGLRVGKIKTPLGLYNEVRDTDALHPMAILPQSIYDEALRSLWIAYNGVALYGKIPMGKAGNLSYHLFTGSINHLDDAPYVEQIRTGINAGIGPYGMSIQPVTMRNRSFFGGRLIFQTPFKGLRLGGSLVYLKAKIDTFLDIPGTPSIPHEGAMELAGGFFLSGEFTLGNLTLTSEYMELPLKMILDLFGERTVLSDETFQGWYLMAAYVFGDRVTLSALYDQYYGDKGDTAGYSATKMGYPDYFAWQKDWAFGLRIDLNFNWTAKLEWHMVDGLAKSYVFAGVMDTKRHWNIIVAKLSYNF